VAGWLFFTNHMHVIILLARKPDLTLREIAGEVGITERAAHRIVSELVADGYLSRERVGKGNRYAVHADAALRHPLNAERSIGDVIRLFSENRAAEAAPSNGSAATPAEDVFRAAFEGLPTGVVVSDATGRPLAVNRAFCSILGRSEAELLDSDFRDWTHPEDISADEELVRQLVSGEANDYTREKRYIRADGRVTSVKLHVIASADPKSRAPLLIAHVIETSEQQRHAQELAEAEERFRSAFDNAPIGMALVAPDGRFLKVNRALCQITGYAETALIRLSFQNITHPDDLDADLAYVAEMLAGKRQTYQMEKRYRHADGHIVWVTLSVSLIRDPAGNPLYFISQIEGIGERGHRRRTQAGQNLSAVASH
jgi:PAS domain S-box-containing protein